MSFPRYPAYKDSGVEWLGEVPEHWEEKPLKTVTSINDEVLSESVSTDHEMEYVDISSVSLANGIERTESVIFGDAPSRARRIPRDGDVLVSTVRTYLKAIAPVVSPPSNLVASTGFAVVRPQRGIHPGYLKYALQEEHFIQQVISRSTGVSYPAINASDIARIPLSLPKQSEQLAIATFLDHETAKIDALITEQQHLIELLQEKRQAVISHTVTKGLNPDAPLKDSGVEWLGEVPEHWTVMPLRLAARIESGHTPSRSHEEYWIEKDCVYPWFTLGDVWQIRDGKAEYVFETQEKVSQVGLDNSAARMLPANTVILSRTASVGFSGILGVSMATTQDFVNWVCGPKIAPEFLLFVFRAMSKEFERLKYGSTHNTIYMPDIFSFRVALPSLIEQGEIVSDVRESLRRLDGSFDDLLSSKELLKERRSALISAAVTGQIDVRGLVTEACAA